MSKQAPVYLHALPMMTEFKYNGKKYRTIVPIAHLYVNACHKRMNREVMDLSTYKTVRLPYFTPVTVVSEKIEKCEK